MGGSAIPGATEVKGRMETCRNPESTGHGSMEKEQSAQAGPWDAVDSYPPGNEEQSGTSRNIRKCKEAASFPARQEEWVCLVKWQEMCLQVCCHPDFHGVTIHSTQN